ncbi:MAG: cyclic nucleotide-binding protein [Flammeovirgaceae bacterium]|nr:cyclic nucleotide-binding protein [Flammeovirgaceae bacterium]HCX20963.1 Crp/Fnr family transcriptional regulator [Cytophagales bacterium]
MKRTILDQLHLLMPPNHAEDFVGVSKIRNVKKGGNFIEAGSVPRKIAFVGEGLFRYYYLGKDGQEFTKGIFSEGGILASYSAMIGETPSHFFIQALEPSTILEVNWGVWNELKAKNHFWDQFLFKMLEKGFITKERRERELLLLDAETRYRNFLDQYPGLEDRLTQKIIASYLGVKPESLSRIRRKFKALT